MKPALRGPGGRSGGRDGRLLASGDANGVVAIWNTDGGRLLHRTVARWQPIGALAFSPSGDRQAVGAWTARNPRRAGR